MNFHFYGFPPALLPDNHEGLPARVTAVHRELFEIVCPAGTGLARLKAGSYHGGDELFPVTGDFVLLHWQSEGESLILKTLPRHSRFARRAPSLPTEEQTVAANFDYVCILQALDRDFNLRRLERYLALARQSGGTPLVLLTKADNAGNYADRLRAAEQLANGVGVFAVSGKTGAGLPQLAPYLKPGKTLVFLGSSGVGKSTLINALLGEKRLATGDVRAKDGRGRHTTTTSQLLLLECGAAIIDTPGMRELGLWDAEEGLEQSFEEVTSLLGLCRFGDCRHEREPGCAIKAALCAGQLSRERWESYRRLHSESQYSQNKERYLREKQQRFKEIAKLRRTTQAIDYRHAPCTESFVCSHCGASATPDGAGTRHRNHCPHCLSSLHLDNLPGDRASLCKGIMDAIGVWVRQDGEWALIHRCRSCGVLHSNRIGADDDQQQLLALARKPLEALPFPL